MRLGDQRGLAPIAAWWVTSLAACGGGAHDGPGFSSGDASVGADGSAGASSSPSSSPSSSSGAGSFDWDGGGATVGSGVCTGDGYNCKIDRCDGGPKTTVTGKVYDPAGKVPLPNVVVYVPNESLDAIPTGPTCDNCATPVSGSPVASALTDATGQFLMQDVPVGTDVPLVIQIGKWRRLVALPSVVACQDNRFDDPSLLRLPANQSEGDLPRIALAVGGADTIECLLRRIGIADSEFTDPSGTGRVNLFVDDIAGSAGVDRPTQSYATGAAFPPFSQLFTSVNAADDGGFYDGGTEPLGAYDVVMIACQGSQEAGRSVTSADKQALKAFVDSGGRAFLAHYNYSWLRGGGIVGSKDPQPSAEGSAIDLQTKYAQTPFPPMAVWEDPSALTYAPGGDGTYLVDTSFPNGNTMAEWLVNVGASTTSGQLSLVNVKNPATSVLPGVAQRWIYQSSMGEPYVSANTPIEQAANPKAQCGRVVHTGIHVAAAVNDTHAPFPGGCLSQPLTAQEKALEFMFFDLSSCVSNEMTPPVPPAVLQ